MPTSHLFPICAGCQQRHHPDAPHEHVFVFDSVVGLWVDPSDAMYDALGTVSAHALAPGSLTWHRIEVPLCPCGCGWPFVEIEWRGDSYLIDTFYAHDDPAKRCTPVGCAATYLHRTEDSL